MTLIDLTEAKRTLRSMADSIERELGPTDFVRGYRAAIDALDVVRPVQPPERK